jgi:hypothetical protein
MHTLWGSCYAALHYKKLYKQKLRSFRLPIFTQKFQRHLKKLHIRYVGTTEGRKGLSRKSHVLVETGVEINTPKLDTNWGLVATAL